MAVFPGLIISLYHTRQCKVHSGSAGLEKQPLHSGLSCRQRPVSAGCYLQQGMAASWLLLPLGALTSVQHQAPWGWNCSGDCCTSED